MNKMNLKLHHIGILVKDINKASSEYVQKFGYSIQSGIIHDPVQTAFVQFLKLQDDAAYVELIYPDGPGSKLTKQLKKGGGLNHFCYQTEHIEDSCRDLYAKGMFILQQPVAAVAFPGRRIAWCMGGDGIPVELVEKGDDAWKTP